MSKLKLSTLANIDDTKSVPVDTVVQGSAKAWVNFNGTGTVAIRAAFNVSSITDNGVGDYTVNFTAPLVDANYCVAGSTVGTNSAGGASYMNGHQTGAGLSTSSCRIAVRISTTAVFADYEYNHVAIFR